MIDFSLKETTLFPAKKRVNAQILANFSYQMAAMLKAGLPLLTTIEIASQKTPKSLYLASKGLIEDLKKGKPLAVAMKKQPQIFPPLMYNMVEAGELGGILEEVFSWLAVHYEKEHQLRQKIGTALIYPFLLLLLTLGVLVFLLTFVVPSYSIMLENLGVALPTITLKIIGLGNFFAKWGFSLVLFFLFIFFLLYIYLKTPEGRVKWDGFYLTLPIIGDLAVKILSSRFCQLLGALLDKGVPILAALEVVKKTMNNTYFISGLSNAQKSLKEGEELSEPLKELEFLPDILIKMIEVGEKTGQLTVFLLRLQGYFEKEVEKLFDRITKLLEPTLILLMGSLIGIIVLALLLPLFNLFTII